MRQRLLFILPAGIAGALMAVQGGLNALLAKIIGLTEATFSVHFLATITALLLLIPSFLKGINLGTLSKVPWYLWIGGPLGVAITYGVVISFPKLGAGKATTAIIACQLLTAYLLDHLGWLDMPVRPLRPVHLIGILLMALGVHLLWQER
ncbi:MAG TPA: DMT family transporter [Bacillota bacterium]|nr:DMT family transporter [Bacillota bacterium]